MNFNSYEDLSYNAKVKIVFNNSAFGPGIARIMSLVKETNKLSEAYKVMGLSPSKGWKIIKRVEKELGFPLFVSVVGGKGGGKSELTAKGEDLLFRYESFVNELNIEAEKLFHKYFSSKLS